MKGKILVLLLLSVGAKFFSQEKISQEDYQKLKEEIKKEILLENQKKEEVSSKEKSKSVLGLDRFSLSGYGAVNYYNYGQFDTDNEIKDKIDAERLNLYLGYKFTEKIFLKTEIELEHGGTGSTMELDVQEETGEFEQELEAGGEVKLEQVHLDFRINPAFNIRLGRMKLHFNLAQNLDRPTAYFTTYRPEMENETLPLGWYENGIQFYGEFLKRFRYEFSITNGLDASGFSSRNWVQRGHQVRFEMANAESPAFTARLDYKFGKNKNTYAGVGAYINNTAPNRPKEDFSTDAYATIFTGHITYDEDFLRFNSVVVWGNIQNSDLVTKANSRVSNALGVKRTPVGKEMLGWSAEIGYDILHLFQYTTMQKLYPFIRYDYYDTMHKVEGDVVRKPIWERKAFTAGANWLITPNIVLKAHYQWKTLGGDYYDVVTKLNTNRSPKENTFSAGVAFSF